MTKLIIKSKLVLKSSVFLSQLQIYCKPTYGLI